MFPLAASICSQQIVTCAHQPPTVQTRISPLFQVAVKFVSKKMQKKEQVAHEADVLLHVQNHQLVALLDTYESPTCLMLVLEL